VEVCKVDTKGKNKSGLKDSAMRLPETERNQSTHEKAMKAYARLKDAHDKGEDGAKAPTMRQARKVVQRQEGRR
jgi:hypothetical protein